MRALLAAADAVDALSRAAGALAAALVLALAGLVGWNVVGRYVGGGSPVALQELEWHLLPPIALLGVVALMREGGHVRVDMLYERMGPRARTALDLVAMLAGAGIALLFLRYSLGFVESAWAVDEGSPDPGGLPMRWLLKATLPAGFAALALQCLANAARAAAALRAGPASAPAEGRG